MATTGRKTSVTGLVGLAFRPTERLIGTRSNLKTEGKDKINMEKDISYTQIWKIIGIK